MLDACCELDGVFPSIISLRCEIIDSPEASSSVRLKVLDNVSQCVLLLLHIVGQGPAVLAAGAGRVGYNVLSFGRRMNMTEIFRVLNSKGSCQLLPRTSSLSTD